MRHIQRMAGVDPLQLAEQHVESVTQPYFFHLDRQNRLIDGVRILDLAPDIL